jgi:adenine-specific DNA methylase
VARARRLARARAALASELRGDATLAQALCNTLSASEKVTRYTHAFHTYPAGMHPDTARDLLALFPSDSVLDPFCGGGSVLVEARAAGRATFGADVSPVAVRVTRARCATPDEAQLTALRSRARKLAAEARAAARNGPLPDAPILRAVETWYAPHALRELECLRRGIAASEPGVRELLEAAFSSLLIKVSWRASDTKAVREKHARPLGTTAVLFHKRVRELARQLAELRAAVPAGTPEVQLARADARELDMEGSVGLVLTSPPYPSTYDYLPMQHLRHVWLGERVDPAREIGARRSWRKGAQQAREAWYADTDRWTSNAARLLAPGGHLVVVIGDGIVPAGVVDAAQPTLAAAARAGLSFLAGASLERPDYAGLANRREHVFAFRKTR